MVLDDLLIAFNRSNILRLVFYACFEFSILSSLKQNHFTKQLVQLIQSFEKLSGLSPITIICISKIGYKVNRLISPF